MSIAWVKSADNFFQALEERNKVKMRLWLDCLLEGPCPTEDLRSAIDRFDAKWRENGLKDEETRKSLKILRREFLAYKEAHAVHLQNQYLKRVFELELPFMMERTHSRALAAKVEKALEEDSAFALDDVLLYRKLAHLLWTLLGKSLKGEKIKKKHLIVVKKLRKRLDAIEPRL